MINLHNKTAQTVSAHTSRIATLTEKVRTDLDSTVFSGSKTIIIFIVNPRLKLVRFNHQGS